MTSIPDITFPKNQVSLKLTLDLKFQFLIICPIEKPSLISNGRYQLRTKLLDGPGKRYKIYILYLFPFFRYNK